MKQEQGSIIDETSSAGSVGSGHRLAAWCMGVVSVAFYAGQYVVSPPLEGDAVAYSEIAQNLLATGDLVQRYLTFPAFIDFPLPVPAMRQATLYALVCLPFEFLLGPSPLVQILPFLLALLVLPRLALAALGGMFGGTNTLVGMAAVLLHPRLLAHFSHDPNVEVLLTELVLLSIWSFSRRRAYLTGIFVGLAFLAKVNSVVLGPAFLFALSLREPRRMLQWDTWKGVGVGLLIVSPLLLRFLWLETSGIPWSEESLLFERLTPEAFRTIGSYETYFFQVPEGPLPLAENSLSDWIGIVNLNTLNNMFFGTKGAFNVDVGAFAAIGWIFIPFVLLGLRAIPDRVERAAVIGLVATFIVFHCLTVAGVDRFMTPILPLTSAAAVAGLRSTFQGAAGMRVAIGLVILRVLPGLLVLLQFLVFVASTWRHFEDIPALRRAVVTDRGPNIILPPHVFASYHVGGTTVPLPVGSMRDVLRLAEYRDAAGLILGRYREGACLPYDKALRPQLLATSYCYYRFDRPPSQIAASAGDAFLDFEPFAFVFPTPAKWNDPARSAIVLIARHAPQGINVVLLGLLCWLLVRSAKLRSPWLAWPLSVSLCTLTAVVALGVELINQHPYPPTPGQLRVQGEVPKNLTFEYGALPLLDDAGQAACAPLGAARRRCPLPADSLRCIEGGEGAEALLIACQSWARPDDLGPEELIRLTRELERALDARAAKLSAKGLATLRMDRMLIAWPPVDRRS